MIRSRKRRIFAFSPPQRDNSDSFSGFAMLGGSGAGRICRFFSRSVSRRVISRRSPSASGCCSGLRSGSGGEASLAVSCCCFCGGEPCIARAALRGRAGRAAAACEISVASAGFATLATLPPRSVAKEARTVDIAKVRKARFRSSKRENTKTTFEAGRGVPILVVEAVSRTRRVEHCFFASNVFPRVSGPWV